MHVCLDGPALWVAAYDARLWSDSQRTIGWIADPETQYHDSQIVVGAPSTVLSGERSEGSERPVLERLLGDPILTARMVAGLGGPPPQLEWLLDAEPMAKLFEVDEKSTADEQPLQHIRYQSISERDGVWCVVVVASTGDESYRFWIDRDRSCIHAVELPAVVAGQPIELDGWTIESLELVLHEARFRAGEAPFVLEQMPKFDFPKRPQYVNALIPLPPPAPHRRLGSTLPNLSVGDRAGRLNVTQRGFDRQLTLWLAAADTPESQAGLDTLALVRAISGGLDRSSKEANASVRPVVLANEQSADTLEQARVGPAGWVLIKDSQAELTQRLGLKPRQCLLSNAKGRVLWVGQANVPIDLASLPGVLQDTLAGYDVPKRLRDQWQSDRQAYQQKLAEVRANVPR